MLSVTVQDQRDAPTLKKAEKPVDVYDFRRPTTLAREQSRVLELAFETFARQWGTQLTANVRVMSQVTCENVTMLTYDEYSQSLPAATVMMLVAIDESPAKAVIQFPGQAALSWIAYMLGGNGKHDQPERKLTVIEQALVRRLLDDALEDLRYAFQNLIVAPISLDVIQYNSQFAQAAATTDLMIVSTFTVRVGDRIESSTIAIPADSLLPQLNQSSQKRAAASAHQLMHEHVRSTPVDVTLRLSEAAVTPGRIVNLSVGDLIPFPHPQHRPFQLAIGGQAVGQAAIGTSGSRLACVIVSTEEIAR